MGVLWKACRFQPSASLDCLFFYKKKQNLNNNNLKFLISCKYKVIYIKNLSSRAIVWKVAKFFFTSNKYLSVCFVGKQLKPPHNNNLLVSHKHSHI